MDDVVHKIARRGPNALTLLLDVSDCTFDGKPAKHVSVGEDGKFTFEVQGEPRTTTNSSTPEVLLTKDAIQDLTTKIEILLGKATKSDGARAVWNVKAANAEGDEDAEGVAAGGGGGI